MKWCVICSPFPADATPRIPYRKVMAALQGRELKEIIIMPGRLVNVVI